VTAGPAKRRTAARDSADRPGGATPAMPSQSPSAQAPWTIGRLLAWTRSHLESRAVEDARLAAELLLACALGCRRIDLYARFEEAPSEESRAKFREMVAAAADHCPIAYITGRKEFYSLDFVVTPDVLIPRPETELLVERALAWLAEHPAERHDVLDLCTGSGCVAIALCKRNAAIRVVATDICEKALVVAAENAKRLNVADRIGFSSADFLELPPKIVPLGGFDLVTANPPYIGEDQRDTLPENVRRHEPRGALFAGRDGLDPYRRVARDILRYLRPTGILILEIGRGQGAMVREILGAAGLEWVAGFKDLRGIERALEFRRSPSGLCIE